MFNHLILVTCFIIPTARASGWDDFTDNLATDLAPLISLFGERLTTQFLSESISLLDNFIFALAPLGILTAVVSVIRVCGNPSLRAFIGRAQEGPGEADHELLSCVSETTAELFNNGGISRVFGRPRLLEVVVWKDRDPASKMDCWKIGTLRDALQQGAWVSRDGGCNLHDREEFLPELEIPNLSLNKGIVRRSQAWFYCAAIAGFVLQTGVLAYSALTVFIYPDRFQKDGEPVEDYAFPLFFIGTICLCTGMFLCAFIIERSSKEFYFHPAKPSKIYWLQPGGQNVGDQVFDSFLAVNEGSGSQPAEGLRYIKSIRDHTLQDNPYLLILTIAFTIIGFVAQFVGLRGLHSSVTLAQMGSTLVMAIVRTCLRTKRISSKENRLSKQEQRIASYKNQELDCFAFHLERVKSFSLVSVTPRGSSSYQPSLSSNASTTNSIQLTGLGATLIQTRAQLAALTSDTSQLRDMGWDNLPIRQMARTLAQALEMTMDLLSTWTKAIDTLDGFDLAFVCQSHQKSIAPVVENYRVSLEKTDDTLHWRVSEHKLEAVLGLWTWSLLSSTNGSNWLRNGLGRLVGLDESEARAENTDLYFHKWMFRQTEARMVSSKMISFPQEMFGFYSNEFPDEKDILVVRTKNNLETMAAQDIYIHFLKSVLRNLEALGGDINVLPGYQNRLYAYSSRLEELVDCVESSGLGSREDALLCIVPIMKNHGLLPELDGYSGIVQDRIEELIASKSWTDAFSTMRWLCECCEGVEFEYSLFELGYLCRRAMLQLDPNLQREGFKQACLAIAADPRGNYFEKLGSTRPTSWMNTKKRLECWKEISLQVGWVMWHIVQRHSNKQSMQDTLTSLGISDNCMSMANGVNNEEQKRRATQAVLHWLTNSDEKLFSRDLLGTDDRLALDWVCQNGHHALMHWLIARWVEFDKRCPGAIYNIILWVVEGRYGPAFASLRRRGANMDAQNATTGSTVLIDKIMESDQQAVKELLGAGADIDGEHANGATPLTVACHAGDVGMVSLLLSKGATVNTQNADGFSPLVCSILENHVAVARALFDHGADPNMSNFGASTPLMRAAADNRVEMVELLLSRGADVDMQTQDGDTALMLAARNECTEATKLLLKHGADISKRMLGGRTALEWAQKAYETEAFKLLEAASAKYP